MTHLNIFISKRTYNEFSFQALKEDTNATDNSLEALEHDALNALEHVDETRSKHSSSSSESSRHSRNSSSSSKSSGRNKGSDEHSLLTEM